MIQRLMYKYKFSEGYGTVRQRSISITSTRACTALQAQELYTALQDQQVVHHYKLKSLYSITSSTACTRATSMIQRLMYECGEGYGAVRQRQRSISNFTESSNGDNGVVKMLLIASDFIDLTITKV